jgi:molybdopterin molybdotransferase
VAGLISTQEARQRVLSRVQALPAESVTLTSALGRTLAEDVGSSHDVPPFESSAMDGFAVLAGPARELRVVGESRAGHPAAVAVEQGTAVRISTGAQVPAGANAVVPIERADARDGTVAIPETAPGTNVRHPGEDVRAGSTVLRRGTVLGAAELGVLASLGQAQVPCARQPRLALVLTGDELTEPGRPLRPGCIWSSNGVALAAQAERHGARTVSIETVPDERQATLASIARALDAADVICVSGGVSVGEHDHVKAAFAELGVEEVFWGVRLKPGKPTWFGLRDERPAFGLPGNPVSAMVTFELFVRPALRGLQGAGPDERRASAVLDQAVTLDGQREQAVRVRLRADEDGWHATPTGPQGSHVLTSMLDAGALALLPAGDGELGAGTRVEVELL